MWECLYCDECKCLYERQRFLIWLQPYVVWGGGSAIYWKIEDVFFFAVLYFVRVGVFFCDECKFLTKDSGDHVFVISLFGDLTKT